MTALALVLVALARAQAPPPAFPVGVEAVYVDVFVSEHNRPVAGLTAADFELRDDGRPRRVDLVAVESLALSVFLVLDTSSSVDGEKLVQLQAAARALLGGHRPGDRAALVTFGNEIRVRVPLSGDPDLLTRRIGGILPGGATALFDALYATALLASGHGRSLVVVFTDGEDNLSWLDAEQIRRVLLESNVLVQAVGIVPREERGFYPGTFIERPPSEPLHVRSLRRLAEVTGGRFWTASAPDRLAEAFLGILEAMKMRYVLRFEPAGERREGLHQLEVKLTRRRGRVDCRKAYFVGPAAP